VAINVGGNIIIVGVAGCFSGYSSLAGGSAAASASKICGVMTWRTSVGAQLTLSVSLGVKWLHPLSMRLSSMVSINVWPICQ